MKKTYQQLHVCRFVCQKRGKLQNGCLLLAVYWKAAASGDMSFKEAPGPAEGQNILTCRGGMKKEGV